MAFVMMSIIEFCLETQPGFYIELQINNSKCHWDSSTANIHLVMPVNWVTTFFCCSYCHHKCLNAKFAPKEVGHMYNLADQTADMKNRVEEQRQPVEMISTFVNRCRH